MKFEKSGRVKGFHLPNNLDANAIRSVKMQKRETLGSIEREIERLVEQKKVIEDEIIQLDVALSHHNHNRLPNEVLSRVFVLVAQDYGPVYFPIPVSKEQPQQLAISHVCSHWRGVALRTPELWSNTRLIYPGTISSVRRRYLSHWQRWVLRAGAFPVVLSIDFRDSNLDSGTIASGLRMLLPLQVKQLHLFITYKNFAELSTLSETMLPDLTDLDLDLIISGAEVDTEMNDPHYLKSKLRSLVFRGEDSDFWIDKLPPNFPWSQLRFLDLGGTCLDDANHVVNILRQTPMLEVLKGLKMWSDFDAVDRVTMPALREFSLEDDGLYMDDERPLEDFLRIFICPSLSKFELDFMAWTNNTFDILKRQYNIQGLVEIDFIGCPLPVSYILRSAPALRKLSVLYGSLLDDAAIVGISNGTLGRCLNTLCIGFTCPSSYISDAIDMAEARMKTVNRLIEDGCSWREDITILKDVLIRSAEKNARLKKSEAVRIARLEEAGIHIALSD